mmetsp:Transcript_8105/g.29912  ORF Transcript_8105/g.29912 Transcript_8105/m.29912 type:complete len:329 (+) Transcript_8105:1427-2413(+)
MVTARWRRLRMASARSMDLTPTPWHASWSKSLPAARCGAGPAATTCSSSRSPVSVHPWGNANKARHLSSKRAAMRNTRPITSPSSSPIAWGGQAVSCSRTGLSSETRAWAPSRSSKCWQSAGPSQGAKWRPFTRCTTCTRRTRRPCSCGSKKRTSNARCCDCNNASASRTNPRVLVAVAGIARRLERRPQLQRRHTTPPNKLGRLLTGRGLGGRRSGGGGGGVAVGFFVGDGGEGEGAERRLGEVAHLVLVHQVLGGDLVREGGRGRAHQLPPSALHGVEHADNGAAAHFLLRQLLPVDLQRHKGHREEALGLRVGHDHLREHGRVGL